MKLLLIALTTIASFFVTNVKASDDNTNVSTVVLKSFERSFKQASNINWTISENLYKADFSLNNQQIAAYFDAEGELIAVTRNILSQQLPIMLQANLKTDYKEFWISELFEVANEGGTTYYVTLEDSNNKIVLKSASNSDWTNYKKIRKS